MPDVVNKVLDRQFEDYLSKSHNVSKDKLSRTQMDKLRSEYANEMYPGLKLPPQKIISQLISQNPAVTLSSEVLVDTGNSKCSNFAGGGKDDLKCPVGPQGPWDEFEINKDGNRRVMCFNPDVTLGKRTTGGSSYLENDCKHDPNLPPCGKDSMRDFKGNMCTGYGANRLGFSLDDSSLQEKLFAMYCDSKADSASGKC